MKRGLCGWAEEGILENLRLRGLCVLPMLHVLMIHVVIQCYGVLRDTTVGMEDSVS